MISPAPSNSGAPSAQGPELVCGDPFTTQLLALADRVARTDVTVLIGGPSGTGKEVLARYLHSRSLRATAPFIAFNCACLPETMVEDMLFGHEKGSFTGAVAKFDGYFAQADGGTLFLDEVGELPLAVQAKLLRVLQEREYTPLGSVTPRKTHFRLLAATNRDLKQDLETGKFREDLYYRLSIFPLSLRPLRDRPGDILPLVRAMLIRYEHIGRIGALDESALGALLSHSWPGNVRELENVIQRALIVADGQVLQASHLTFDFASPTPPPAATPASVATPAPGAPQPAPELLDNSESLVEPAEKSCELLSSRRDVAEAHLILSTLRSAPTKAVAAARLGISERTLRYKLARYREHGILAATA